MGPRNVAVTRPPASRCSWRAIIAQIASMKVRQNLPARLRTNCVVVPFFVKAMCEKSECGVARASVLVRRDMHDIRP